MDEAQRKVRAMSASTFFGDKLEDGREAAGGTWWTRRREVAEFAEEDKKVKVWPLGGSAWCSRGLCP